MSRHPLKVLYITGWCRNGSTIIVGDYTAAATIFDSGRSVIRFAEAPKGIFPREGLAVCGEIYESLVVHLPTHFYVAALV